MKPVLFSVSYAGFWGQAKLTLEEFIPHAKALGYEGLELMCKRPHLSPLDYTDEKVSKLRDLCKKTNIEVTCLAAYTNFTGGMESSEVPFVEMQIQYVESLGKIAQELGCGFIRIFTSYERADVPMARQWQINVDAIQQCCDRAAKYNVKIGIQNHHDMAVHSKALLELYNEVNRPNCVLMFDPWSPCLRGEELFETAKSMAKHTGYTTLADYIRLPRFQYQPNLINYKKMDEDLVKAVPMGDGDLDSLTFIKGLKAGGYEGPIAYEMCSPLRGGGSKENLDKCAKAFLQWLKANKF